MKKILCIILALTLGMGCMFFAHAQEEAVTEKSLRVVSFNVDGLPIPSFLSSTKRPAGKATRLIAEQLNRFDCDILCAQEDFNYHGTLRRELDMPYATVTSGPAVIGDGLNIFADYPVYNVGREAWSTAYGIFDCGSDELTPKGILYCTVELAEGIYVDVYTLHADAWEDDDSMLAKAAQFDQLAALIEAHSGDRAVLLTGDFNVNYAVFREGYKGGRYNVDLCQKLLDNFVAKGFHDAWIEANNDGNYDFTYGEMRSRYGCEYPRTWDTLDHIFYRDGKGVSFTLEDAWYDGFDCAEITWDGHLSDHAAVCAVFTCKLDAAQADSTLALQKEWAKPITHFFHGVVSVCRTLYTVIVHIPDLFRNGIGWIK